MDANELNPKLYVNSMNKTTIELHRIKDTTANVSHRGVPWTDADSTMNIIVEWSQRPENLSQRIYRHAVYYKEENVREEPHSWSDSSAPEFVYPCKCDYVTYLDIYHQGK